MPPQWEEVIDLTLDSDDEALPPAPAYLADHEAQPNAVPEGFRDADGVLDLDVPDDYFPMPGQFDDPPLPAMGDLRDVPLVIDDFGYLDEEPQEVAGAEQENRDLELARNLEAQQQQILTKDDCLARVYEMFPDVCPEHTTTVYEQVGADVDYELPAAVRLDRIIEKLIADAPYPKRQKESQHLKRKREESAEDDYKRWERHDRENLPRFLVGSIRSILKAEFPTFTHAEINNTVHDETYLYKSYVRLAELRDTDSNPRRGRPSVATSAETIIAGSGWPELTVELAAARKRAEANRTQREEEKTKKRAEDDNLRRAIARGRTAECQACFDDLPMNRQVHCHGDEPHFTCFSCIETYIKSEIGDSRCRVLCTAGCGAGFEPAQLNLISDKKLLQKLADLQQEKDIRDAGLDDLEECPFCDYKAIMPAIEEDFEFRCANPDCEKVSCRRCKAISHIPISCEQYAKEKKANSRHTIEEAMTAALIRTCNKCKKQFIKEFGCNKMTCPSCKNLQCYCCSETLKGYDHFDQTPQGDPRPGGKCPLYDNMEQRHEREIKAAEETARAKVIAANPDVQPEDLEIKLSDAVKQSTAQKIQRAGPEGLGGGAQGWNGGVARGFRDIFADFENLDGEEDAMDMDAFIRNRINRPPVRRAPRYGRNVPGRERRFGPYDNVAGRRILEARRELVAQQNAEAERVQRQNRERMQQEPDRQREARDHMNAMRAQRAQQAAMLGMPGLFANNIPPVVQGPAQAPRQYPQPMPGLFPHDDPNLFMRGWHDFLPQAGPQPMAPALPPLNNGPPYRPFQRGPVPNGFGAPGNNLPPMQDFLQIARNNMPLPHGDPVPDQDGRQDRLANVARNLHQLELMRLQHDARNGNVVVGDVPDGPADRARAARRRHRN